MIILKLYIEIIILFLSLPLFPVQAQMEIHIPSEINLTVNHVLLSLSQGWLDSLIDEANSDKIRYKIVGAWGKNTQVITFIQLPQILSLDQVYRQVILYYSMLDGEIEREREFLRIYPYFVSPDSKPSLTCYYQSEGQYDFEVKDWTQVAIPPGPTPEERHIFNQIMQASFNGVQSFTDVSEEIFKKIALQYNLPVEYIEKIYKNTILWQQRL
jgi:hypothetical protein